MGAGVRRRRPSTTTASDVSAVWTGARSAARLSPTRSAGALCSSAVNSGPVETFLQGRPRSRVQCRGRPYAIDLPHDGRGGGALGQDRGHDGQRHSLEGRTTDGRQWNARGGNLARGTIRRAGRMAIATVLKTVVPKGTCGFESHALLFAVAGSQPARHAADHANPRRQRDDRPRVRAARHLRVGFAADAATHVDAWPVHPRPGAGDRRGQPASSRRPRRVRTAGDRGDASR
jgi:hypothetical protein